MVPDQALVVSELGTQGEHIRAARASDNSFAYVYLPRGKEVRVAVERLGSALKAAWYDPRTGVPQPFGVVSGTPVLQPPTDEDWLLILEAQS